MMIWPAGQEFWEEMRNVVDRSKPAAYADDMSKLPQILNVQQLAERLGVTRRTVHNWLRAGNLPIPNIVGMKPPKWRASDVEQFLNVTRGDV